MKYLLGREIHCEMKILNLRKRINELEVSLQEALNLLENNN